MEMTNSTTNQCSYISISIEKTHRYSASFIKTSKQSSDTTHTPQQIKLKHYELETFIENKLRTSTQTKGHAETN